MPTLAPLPTDPEFVIWFRSHGWDRYFYAKLGLGGDDRRESATDLTQELLLRILSLLLASAPPLFHQVPIGVHPRSSAVSSP